MTIKPLFQWKAPDSTADLNGRVREIRRSIFPAPLNQVGVGLVTPSTSNLTVTVTPFLAQGFDGMAVSSDATLTTTLPVPPSGPAQVYWLTLFARYQLQQPAQLVFAFVPDSTITSAADRDFYIRFAKVTVAPSTTNAAAATWDFGVGDHSESLGQSRWRQPVATAASLPVGPTFNGEPPNKDGDVRVALDTHFAYVWNSLTASWSVVSGAGSLTAATARSNELDRKFQRSNQGTGFLGLGHNEGAFADSVGAIGAGFRIGDGPVVSSTPSTYNLRVAPFQLSVNGHKVAIGDTTIPLPTAPVSTRYDLVYLEVYRSRIVTPVQGIVYANNLGGTYTFAQIETLIEQVVNEDPYFASSNFQFGGVELGESGDVIVTLWKWSVQQGIAFTGPAPAVNYVVSGSAPCTVPGFVATTYAAAAHNARIGIATNNALAPGIWDGTAYAVPVFVCRRNIAEASYAPVVATGPDLSGVTIWNLLPTADSEVGRPGLRRLVQDKSFLDCAPGVLDGYEDAITWTNGGAGGPLTINMPAVKFALTFPSGQYASAFPGTLPVLASAQSLRAPTPPVTGARRDFVYMVYWTTPSYMVLPTSSANQAGKAFASPVTLLDTVVQGGRTLYVYGMYVVASIATATDEADGFAATFLSLYETGGAIPFTPVAGSDHPGLWSATVTGSPLSEHGIDRAFAMPVAVLHRRNSTLYSDTLGFGTSNFNGSGSTRPEFVFGGAATEAYDLLAREIVDLRHATGEVDLDRALERTMDQVQRGQLATRLVRHPMDGTIAGTTQLCVDVVGSPTTAAVDPAVSIVPASRLDGIYYAFSDAVETQIVSWTTDVLTATVATGADYVIPSSGLGTDAATHHDYVQGSALSDGAGNPIFTVTYNSATPSTKVRIRAPQGAYIHTSMRSPQDFIVNGAVTPPIQSYQGFGLVNLCHIHGGTNAPIGTPRTQVTRSTGIQSSYGGGSYDYRISYNYLHDTAVSATSMTVKAVDAIGRPTDIEVIFPYVDDPGTTAVSSSSGFASLQVAAAFVYDKPKTAQKLRTDYLAYGDTIDDRIMGLSLAPKTIYNIRGVIRGTTYSDISVGPLYRTITKACTGTTQVTISAADFTGETSVAIFGLLGDPLLPSGGTQQVRTLEMSTIPGTSLTVTFDSVLPGAGNVSFKVAYTSDQKKYWFEVYKTSRGLIGPFTWLADTADLNIAGGGTVNSVSAVSETYYTYGVQHPINAQNRFTIGVPNEDAPVAGQIVGENKSLLGWWSKNSAGAANYYVTNDFAWYAGTNVVPWNNGSYGRHDRTASLDFPVLGATAGYFDTYGPHAYFFGGAPNPLSRSTTIVYASPIPLAGSGADFVVVVYEGFAYQGVMGDNDTLVNRLGRLESAIVPASVGEALRYEAVGDVHVTTAGTGLPYLDHRNVGVQSQYFVAGVATPGYRATFYAPDVMKENGVSNAYRAEKLNSERLRPVKSVTDVLYTYPDDNIDLLMNFIPGPPTQYCPKPNLLGVDIGSFAGVGPGIRSDYDHSTVLGGSPVTNDLFLGGDRSGWQRPATVTVRMPGANGYDTVRIPYHPAFLSYWVGYGAPGAAQGDQDILLSQTIGDWWGVGSIQKVGRLAPSGTAPVRGFQLVRTISAGDLTVLKSRLNLFTTFMPEPVGRPNTGSATVAQGSQGYITFRPGFSTALAGSEMTWLGRPSENLLSGCAQDAGLLTSSSLGTYVLTEGSQSVSHQQSGNIFFATQGHFYDQNPADYTAYPTANNVLMPQKLWAFRGSAVNRSGQVRLLINSGFGSDLVHDVQNAGVRTAGTRVHVGFSADAFELLHRPVLRSR